MRVITCAALVLLAACEDKRAGPAAPPQDASAPAADAQPWDIGSPDAAAADADPAPSDAGVTDAGSLDAGLIDTGDSPDAAAPADAGAAADAGPPPDVGPGLLAFDVPIEWAALPAGYQISADLNRDGRRDAVHVDAYTMIGENRVTFALAQAGGGFVPGAAFVVPSNPGIALTFADFDGDMITDVLVQKPSATLPNLFLYIHDGNAGFAAAQPLAFGGDVFADFDGDGRTDVLDVLSAGDSVLNLARPGGAWQQSRIAVRGSNVNAGDFDGDGTTDLAVGTTVHRGLGAGTFAAGLAATCPSCPAARGALVARIDGDTRDDLVLVDTSGLVILLGQADARLAWSTSRVVSRPVHAAAGDVDGDGHTDLVTISEPIAVTSADQLTVLYGDGAGAVTQRVDMHNPRGAVGPPVITDADGDGATDVILGGRWVVHGTGTRRLRAPELSAYSVGGSRSVQVADVDRSGRMDLILARPGAPISVTPFGADRYLGAPTSCNGPGEGLYRAVRDITGDGLVDVFTSDGTNLSVWVGRGGCSFGPEQSSALAIFTSRYVAVDGDAMLDLVFATQGGVAVSLATAPGQFGPPVLSAFSGYAARLAAGDFNGDGHIDVMVLDDDAATATVMNGDAGRSLTAGQVISWPPGETVWYPTPADIDGDGDLDVLVGANGNQGSIDIFRNDGLGAFTRQSLTPADALTQFSVADFDGDGDLELLAADHQLAMSIFSVPVTGPAVRVLQLALRRGAFPRDVDGDGDIDLVYADDYGADGFVAVANNRRID